MKRSVTSVRLLVDHVLVLGIGPRQQTGDHLVVVVLSREDREVTPGVVLLTLAAQWRAV